MGICSSNAEDETNDTQNGIRPLIIKAETWKRDSHGLFDYETTDVVQKTLRIPTKEHQSFVTNIYREECEILIDSPQEILRGAIGHTMDNIECPDTSRNQIANIFYKDGQYWIYKKGSGKRSEFDTEVDYISNPENLIWYTVRDYPNSASSYGYMLKKGDILKFGRARLRVVNLKIGETMAMGNIKEGSITSLDGKLPDGFFVTEEDLVDSPSCRICFAEGDDQNPLISACRCSGSLKFIHYACLKSWLESKRTIKTTESTVSYHWKILECELCKTAYPELIKTAYSLVSYENPYENYMILESISTSSSKSIYVVNLDAKSDSFKIGRGHDSDIRVSDISVSRCHAIIMKTDQNELIIKDNNSKFGTLICLQHPLMISEFDSIHLQAGRTLLEIQMTERTNWDFKSCLWMRQNNQIDQDAAKNNEYLGKYDLNESTLPDELRTHGKSKGSKIIKFERSSSDMEDRMSFEKKPLSQPPSIAQIDDKSEDEIFLSEGRR